MRYFVRQDVVAIKQFTLGLATFSPVLPASVGALFFVHVTFLSVLLAYFPFSKLMHSCGMFFTRWLMGRRDLVSPKEVQA